MPQERRVAILGARPRDEEHSGGRPLALRPGEGSGERHARAFVAEGDLFGFVGKRHLGMLGPTHLGGSVGVRQRQRESPAALGPFPLEPLLLLVEHALEAPADPLDLDRDLVAVELDPRHRDAGHALIGAGEHGDPPLLVPSRLLLDAEDQPQFHPARQAELPLPESRQLGRGLGRDERHRVGPRERERELREPLRPQTFDRLPVRRELSRIGTAGLRELEGDRTSRELQGLHFDHGRALIGGGELGLVAAPLRLLDLHHDQQLAPGARLQRA